MRDTSPAYTGEYPIPLDCGFEKNPAINDGKETEKPRRNYRDAISEFKRGPLHCLRPTPGDSASGVYFFVGATCGFTFVTAR